jgi:hypothetical protein
MAVEIDMRETVPPHVAIAAGLGGKAILLINGEFRAETTRCSKCDHLLHDGAVRLRAPDVYFHSRLVHFFVTVNYASMGWFPKSSSPSKWSPKKSKPISKRRVNFSRPLPSGEKLMVGIPLMRQAHGPDRHLVLDDTPNLPKLVARHAAFAPRELAVSL